MNQITNMDAPENQVNTVPVSENGQLNAQNTETSELPKPAENAETAAQADDAKTAEQQAVDAPAAPPNDGAPVTERTEAANDSPKPLPSTKPIIVTAKREHFAAPHAVEINRDGETITGIRLINQTETEIIGATTIEEIVRANGGEIPAGGNDTLEIKFSPRTGTVMSISAVAAAS